jgi:hypothetical protein
MGATFRENAFVPDRIASSHVIEYGVDLSATRL